jgi:hypothetical protein
MSNRWPGGLIRKTPVTPTGPFQNGAASGVWSLADAAYWTKQGLWPIAGNALPAIEDYFSTYLYTGNGSTQTITNGIDVSGQGGLVWIKKRSASESHFLVNSASPSFRLETDGTGAQGSQSVLSLASSGFSLLLGNGAVNGSGSTYASWTFREGPKFFDVVTFTGTGASQLVSHNLGVMPGLIIYKATNTTSDWFALARNSDGTYAGLRLNLTAQATFIGGAGGLGITDTTFNPNSSWGNTNGTTYVAYLYAHDTASTGLIQCGSFTTDGSSNASVNLGWEPQWLMVKPTSTTGNWVISDTMRGYSQTATQWLYPNASSAEAGAGPIGGVTATGFNFNGIYAAGTTVAYMAIRRGPMKTPTLGTSVFSPNLWSSSTGSTITTNFPVDMQISRYMIGADGNIATDRLRGLNTSTTNSNQPILQTNSNVSESNNGSMNYNYDNVRFLVGGNYTGAGWALNFRRAPGFMDVVAYTGTGSATTLNHNLGVAPELMIVKRRDTSATWPVYAASQGASSYGLLPEGLPFDAAGASIWNSTNPTSSVFSVGTSTALNASGGTYVAYLFASAPGVSKVGTYVGNDTTQTINCGFAAGARFVMIKGISGGGVGGWYIWDSARGINAGNDPYLRLNSTSAQVNTDDSVDADNTGFIVNQNTGTYVNFSGTTYIFLAIA